MCLTVRESTVGWETLLEAGFVTDVVVLLVERELLVPTRFGLLIIIIIIIIVIIILLLSLLQGFIYTQQKSADEGECEMWKSRC